MVMGSVCAFVPNCVTFRFAPFPRDSIHYPMTMAAGVQRVLAKCQKCVESGNFYEAHQMYRTLSFRYMTL